MTEPSRVRNLAVLLVLIAVYTIPAIFVPASIMLDVVSVPMLVFGAFALYLIIGEAWDDFWSGEQSRRAIGLFALTAILLSVVVMRPYGIITRNIEGTGWLSETHIYPVALSIQAVGLWLFTRASETPTVTSRRPGWGKLVAAFVIGVLVASSKVLEPILMFLGRLFSRIF